MAAGVGNGSILDWNFVQGALEEGEIISPNSAHEALYLERYEMYKELHLSTMEISHKLARTR